MKKLNLGLAIAIALFVIEIGFLFFIDHRQMQAMQQGNIDTITDTATELSTQERLKSIPAIDSLPHYLYQRITDSVDRSVNNTQAKNILIPSYGVSLGFLATRCAYRSWAEGEHEEFDQTYYLALPFYSLSRSCQVEMHNGKKYLRYPVWDVTNSITKKGHSEIREIPVYYFREYHELLIPSNEKKFKFLNGLFNILRLGYFLLSLYVVIGLPFNIAMRIARGNVFTTANTKGIYFIAYALIGYFCLRMFSPYILSLLFAGKIPGEFHISFLQLLSDHLSTGVSGALALIIGRAFKKGSQLQQEQELTV